MNLSKFVSFHNKKYDKYTPIEMVNEKDYIINSYLNKEGKLHYYSVFYVINGKYYYTISMISCMRRGVSVLYTREIGSETFYLENMDEKEKKEMKRYILEFKSFLTKQKEVRIRSIIGIFEWNFRDKSGIYKLEEKIDTI